MNLHWRLAASVASICLTGLVIAPLPGQAGTGDAPEPLIGIPKPQPDLDYDVWVQSPGPNECTKPNTICAEVWDSSVKSVTIRCCIYPSSLGTGDRSACIAASGGSIEVSDRDVVPE